MGLYATTWTPGSSVTEAQAILQERAYGWRLRPLPYVIIQLYSHT